MVLHEEKEYYCVLLQYFKYTGENEKVYARSPVCS